jgi:hypothetical protein
MLAKCVVVTIITTLLPLMLLKRFLLALLVPFLSSLIPLMMAPVVPWVIVIVVRMSIGARASAEP